MRTTGKITHWNTDKGYGFITPESGAKQVFVHINAFASRHGKPQLNELVTFSLSTDKQSRPCAVRVRRAAESSPGRIKRNDGTLMKAGALLFVLLMGVAAFADEIPITLLIVYLAASVLNFLVYFMDKSAARTNAQRTPENVLHFWCDFQFGAISQLQGFLLLKRFEIGRKRPSTFTVFAYGKPGFLSGTARIRKWMVIGFVWSVNHNGVVDSVVRKISGAL